MLNLTSTEWRATTSLAALIAIRMLGLFMILPIFSLYIEHYHDATPTLMGIALGIYGLFQAALQMPFGLWSDKIGRKQIIALGLCLFILGSIIAAMSTSIYGVIIGRALQGGGAIGSAVTALLADFTRAEHRTKALAIVGMTIGFSFTGAMILGPIINNWVHLSGLFWLTAFLGLLGMGLLFFVVPPAPVAHFHRETEPVQRMLKATIKNRQLIPLNFGVFTLHCILTATFIVIPLLLIHELHITADKQWRLYLLVLLLSFAIAIPCIAVVEKKRWLRPAMLGAIAFLILTQLSLLFAPNSHFMLYFALIIFFVSFNFLEASLPSLLSRIAPPKNRGTAMGIFSTWQYFGIFIGGSAGGIIQQHFGFSAVFVFTSLLLLCWLALVLRLR